MEGQQELVSALLNGAINWPLKQCVYVWIWVLWTLTAGPRILSLTPNAGPACSRPMNNLSCTYANWKQQSQR